VKWFRKKNSSSANRSENQPPKWLSVQAASARRSRVSGSRAALWIALAVSVGALALLCVAGWFFYNQHFLHNPRYVVHNLNVSGGETLLEETVRAKLVHEGMQLFDSRIEERRVDLLADFPQLISISLIRHLPGSIEVHITEREPVGRVGRDGYVVDKDGVVFLRYARVGQLPVLTGLDGIAVQPGLRLNDGMARAAVTLLTTLAALPSKSDFSLPLLSVDLSKSDYLLLTLADQKQVKLSWKGMDVAGMDSREALCKRLRLVQEDMQTMPQRQMWDATVLTDEARVFSPY
jgi:cell division septal protein FtsQ